jgi:3',5'-cyclic AMP phosphodiesterase CpdA
VLQSGDAVVNGRDARQWNVSFVGLVNRITTEGDVPYFLAPGNHDVTASDDLASPERQAGLANYLLATTLLIPPDHNARRLDGYPTYAFGYGNTFVLAFDSNIADDEPQYAWIATQLEQLDRQRYKNVIALFHHPVYSSGPHGANFTEPSTDQLRERYMPLFRKYRVKLLLTGHEHVYEHWVERWRDSTGRERSMDQIVSGGGGAPLYSYKGEPDLRAYRAAAGRDSVRVQHLVRPGMSGENAYHYVVFHVDGQRISFEVIAVNYGRAFQPYRGLHAVLSDSGAAP